MRVFSIEDIQFFHEVFCPFEYNGTPKYYMMSPNVTTMDIMREKWNLPQDEGNIIYQQLPEEEKNFFGRDNSNAGLAAISFNEAKNEVRGALGLMKDQYIKMKKTEEKLLKKITQYVEENDFDQIRWANMMVNKKKLRQSINDYKIELDFQRMMFLTNAELLLRDSLVYLEYDNKKRSWTGLLSADADQSIETNKKNLRFVTLTSDFVTKNYHERFVKYLKRHGTLDEFVDVQPKETAKIAQIAKIERFVLFRGFDDLKKCNVLGWNSKSLSFVSLADEWFKGDHLSEQQKTQLNESIAKFMRYKDDNIWSLFFEPEKRGERGQKRSQNLVTFTCPHRANLIKLQTEIDKIRNENDHPLPKEKERRVLFLEKKKRDHAHTDQCCAKYEGLSVNIPITVNLKESQLCQIRFNETTQAYEGMVHYLVSNKGRKKEILDTDWVKQNFDENILLQVQQKASNSWKFFKVPPGNPNSTFEIPSNLFKSTLPSIIFRQSPNEKNCLLLSFANAILHNNFETEAWNLFNNSNNLMLNGSDLEIFGIFRDMVKSQFPHHKVEKMSASKDRKCLFSQKNDNYKSVVLLGSDGDACHSITIWRDIVFDSTLGRALPMSINSLDFIVGEGCNYIGISMGYEIDLSNSFFQTRNKKRKKKSAKRASKRNMNQEKVQGGKVSNSGEKNKNKSDTGSNSSVDENDDDDKSYSDMGVL